MTKGYAGKLLRVDLSSGSVQDEPLPPLEVLRQYIGGTGLGVKILSDEMPPDVGVFDPASRIILMTGPLTGTPIPGGNNCAIVGPNADTGFTVGAGHTHGQFGPNMKFAGYDGIVVQGASKKPVYLWVHDGKAELRDASKIWGKDTHETEDLVKAELGDPKASVAAIGPAGENLLGAALVSNDKYHVAAFGGGGAVLGSKQLKAIAVRGKGSVELADPKGFVEAAAEWRPKAKERRPEPASVPKRWYKFGEDSVLATKNLLSPDLGIEIGRRFSKACTTYIKLTGEPCFTCPSACSYKAVVTEGHRKGFVATMGGGGENMEGAAAMVAASDPADILWLTDLYDRMGVNSPTLGCAVALAFECFERGLLTVEDTDGLELRWGNAEAAATLVRQAATRQGFGKILADGPKKAAERIGGDAANYAVWVKGAGFRLHDYRGRYESMLAQALAGAGPRGEGTGMTGAYDPDLGYFKSPDDPMQIPGIYKRIQSKRLFEDSVGVCMFNASTIVGIMGLESRCLAAAIGWDQIGPEEQLTIGERIINVERVFNVGRGLKPSDDMDLSPRVLEPPAEGLFKGRTIAPYLKDLVYGYYQVMGWDQTTGKPRPETLKRLGLGHLADRLQ
ncbi:MAG: hypothetical protein HYY01_02685 [Chloroflexi bacterium]|nr:hypothetical protein [Chloroflexota bacterium]